MKTILAIIGALALLIVVLIGALMVVGYNRAGALTDEAQAYADDSIPAIARAWESEELAKRAAPELIETLKDGRLQQIMRAADQYLGAMTRYDGATCAITHYEYGVNQQELALSVCEAAGEFEKGRGRFTLNLIKREKAWKIYGFFVVLDERKEGPVQVRYAPAQAGAFSHIEISLERKAVGFSTARGAADGAGAPGAAGAHFDAGDKIDNTP